MTQGRVLGGVTLLVTAIAFATGNTTLLRLSYVLMGVFLVSFVIGWLATRWVDVTRHTRSRRAQVGGIAEETFAVHNRGWLPKLWLEIADDSDLPEHRASRVVSALGPGDTRTWTVRTLCTRRGVFTLGPMTIGGGDPLGMFRREVHLPRTASFMVYPLTVSLRGLNLPTGYLPGGQVVRRRAEFTTTNVRGVRPYAPGDAFNRIHWPTTARRQKLYVKEFELDPIADIWVLVDLERHVHVGEEESAAVDASSAALPWIVAPSLDLPPTTEEYTIAAAASLCRHFLGEGKSVGLIAYGQRRAVVRPDRGERQLGKILGHLAVLHAAGRASLSEVLATEGQEFTRHTTLVTVTPATTLRWVDALRELRLRGVGSFVVLVEASTFGTAAGSSLGTLSALAANGIPSRLVKCGVELGASIVG